MLRKHALTDTAAIGKPIGAYDTPRRFQGIDGLQLDSSVDATQLKAPKRMASTKLKFSPVIDAYSTLNDSMTLDGIDRGGTRCADVPSETLYILQSTDVPGSASLRLPDEPQRYGRGSQPLRSHADSTSLSLDARNPLYNVSRSVSLAGDLPPGGPSNSFALSKSGDLRDQQSRDYSEDSNVFATADSHGQRSSKASSPTASLGNITARVRNDSVPFYDSGSLSAALERAVPQGARPVAPAAAAAVACRGIDAIEPDATVAADDDDDWDVMVDGEVTVTNTRGLGPLEPTAAVQACPGGRGDEEPQWTMAATTRFTTDLTAPVHGTGEPQWEFAQPRTSGPLRSFSSSKELDTASAYIAAPADKAPEGAKAPPPRLPPIVQRELRQTFPDLRMDLGRLDAQQTRERQLASAHEGESSSVALRTQPSSMLMSTPSEIRTNSLFVADPPTVKQEDTKWRGLADAHVSVRQVSTTPQLPQAQAMSESVVAQRPMTQPTPSKPVAALPARPAAAAVPVMRVKPANSRSFLSGKPSALNWRGTGVNMNQPIPSSTVEYCEKTGVYVIGQKRVQADELEPDAPTKTNFSTGRLEPTSRAELVLVSSVHAGATVDKWQEIQDQLGKVQKLMKMCSGRPLKDVLGGTQFHPPLYAATWGALMETFFAPGTAERSYKELVAASVVRGNGCSSSSWPTQLVNAPGLDISRAAKAHSLACLSGIDKRQKAIALWFRDASSCQFCQESRLAPFTVREATELLAVAFVSNVVGRVTAVYETRSDTSPLLSSIRPLRNFVPSAQRLFSRLMGSSTPTPPARGAAAELRPPSRYLISYSLRWALRRTEIARALAYWEHTVNLHLRGRFLPTTLCDAVVSYLENTWTGHTSVTDRLGQWALRAARQHAREQPRQHVLAMQYMLVVAATPADVQPGWKRELAQAGWSKRQIKAMAPFAAFHAARVISDWQASTQCVSEEEARNVATWADLDETW